MKTKQEIKEEIKAIKSQLERLNIALSELENGSTRRMILKDSIELKQAIQTLEWVLTPTSQK